GTSVWLAGSRGIVYAEGTQHSPTCQRGENGVPIEGAGTLALTADMKKMKKEFVRGASFKGYGVSLSLGIGIPIPILNKNILKYTTVKNKNIEACVIDYSHDYQQKTGKIIAKVNYEQLIMRDDIEIMGKKVEISSMSSYNKSLEIAEILKDEIKRGDFLISKPSSLLPKNQSARGLQVKWKNK
ncbi:MAG: homocysteine biosynthesis protein, partial [Spirochaetaceae bacterium]|nr:homocysteine biosynthesis protein [Spirochaetaceae bacterium]